MTFGAPASPLTGQENVENQFKENTDLEMKPQKFVRLSTFLRNPLPLYETSCHQRKTLTFLDGPLPICLTYIIAFFIPVKLFQSFFLLFIFFFIYAEI